MVVVDTNILAYLLIVGDRTGDAQALYRRDSDWKSEAFVLVEFSNILSSCPMGFGCLKWLMGASCTA